VSDDELRVGKLPPDLLARVLGSGRQPPDVLVGPALGEDACALDLRSGVLVVATDPVTLTSRQVGRFAVIVNANDVAVMGVRPRWFLACVLLPPGTKRTDVEELFAAMRDELTAVGATLVGGHTEITPAVTQPVVVGQMLGLAEGREFVTTAGARPGDVVVQIGSVPVEGAAVLAAEHHAALGALDASVVRAAADAIDEPGISVVEAALAAAELGATSLHDPTEGGLAAGLHELAARSEVSVLVEPEHVIWFGPGVTVCAALGADPWATLASGSVIATFPASGADMAVGELNGHDHRAAVIGAVAAGNGVFDSNGVSIPNPRRDEVARLRPR
jgi:hydrogenase maturation factor